MKATILAGAVLVFGIVAGFALMGGASDGSVSAAPQCPGPSSKCATPTPPQQREAQIVVADALAFVAGEEWHGFPRVPIVALDPADYPASTEFSFEAVLSIESADTIACTRLYNLTTDLPVEGSEICLESTVIPPSGNVWDRVRIGPMVLTGGENEYSFQTKCLQPACGVTSWGTRVIAEWTE